VSHASSTPLSKDEQILQLQKKLAWAELKIQVLEQRLRLQRIQKYGPASEKLNSEQLQLLEWEPGVSNFEVQAESQREPLPASTQRQKPRPHPGRQELPAELPRVERVIACAPEQCTCPACGKPTAVIGYDVSEQLDVEPAKYFVLVTKREKRACKGCQQGGVSAAPVPARIIDKGLVSDRVVIDTVVSKYSDHLPLYRQSVILARETGVEISRATLDGWVMRVGELLIPIAEAMRHFLGKFDGILQTDGYIAYEHVGGPKMVHVCCWAHARRHFVDAVRLNREDRIATAIVRRMDALFVVDAEARAHAFDHAARHALRLERSKPLLDLLQSEVEAAGTRVLPASALGKAVNYTLGLWPKLTRFLDYPEVELSNNLAENSMRPVALGRKNWIHIGSPQAGPKVAAILSIVESCRRLSIPIREYLARVLPGLADRSVQRVAELTPTAWAQSR